jgi:7-cyano-7-deazaguanine synthase
MIKDTLLIYSGGLDSTSALYAYKDLIKLAISFNYGSRHNHREIEMARLNCEKLGIEHMIINIEEVFKYMKSSLLGSEDVPHGHYEADNMASTVVPFRNGILLSIATGIAESNKLKYVMLASHKGDNAQYPDCTPEFNEHMNGAIRAGTANNVKLMAPFAMLDKKEIAELGVASGVVPELTYSCYEGDAEHCGKCGTCVERIWALSEVNDDTLYKDKQYALDILKEKGDM